jgi:hypothetical protein
MKPFTVGELHWESDICWFRRRKRLDSRNVDDKRAQWWQELEAWRELYDDVELHCTSTTSRTCGLTTSIVSLGSSYGNPEEMLWYVVHPDRVNIKWHTVDKRNTVSRFWSNYRSKPWIEGASPVDAIHINLTGLYSLCLVAAAWLPCGMYGCKQGWGASRGASIMFCWIIRQSGWCLPSWKPTSYKHFSDLISCSCLWRLVLSCCTWKNITRTIHRNIFSLQAGRSSKHLKLHMQCTRD